MKYHKKKYLIDSLNYNFKYNFIDNKLKIYNLENIEVEYQEVLEYLEDEFELDIQKSMEIIFRWYSGNVYADYIDLFEV